MRPDLEHALRLNPRIRKKLREQRQALAEAVERGTAQDVMTTARTLVGLEHEAEADIRSKRPETRRHLIRFRVSEEDYAQLARDALEHRLDPNEVARRYFVCGRRFTGHFWGHVKRGGNAETLFKKGPGGFNPLPAIILPDFTRREP